VRPGDFFDYVLALVPGGLSLLGYLLGNPTYLSVHTDRASDLSPGDGVPRSLRHGRPSTGSFSRSGADELACSGIMEGEKRGRWAVRSIALLLLLGAFATASPAANGRADVTVDRNSAQAKLLLVVSKTEIRVVRRWNDSVVTTIDPKQVCPSGTTTSW